MKIILTGGGSGGHIAPILAVAHELKQQKPSCHIIYIGQSGDDLLYVVRDNPAIDEVRTISAGKLRRYSGEGLRQLLDIRTQFLNIRDIFRTTIGLWQSYRLLGQERPQVVFTRGGFVSVPVALAAKLRHIPYLTHDADSIPSLANRIIARWAALHAVTFSAEHYPYPKDKISQVGIPVGHHFVAVGPEEMTQFRHALELDDYQQVILINGGGNGARSLNKIMAANARYLLATYPDLIILHVAGRSMEEETNAAYDALNLGAARHRVQVYGFLTDFHRYSGAADVVVARGGMSTLAELAQQHKACLIVPSKQLSWNVHNSRTLAEQGAIIELSEDQAEQPERIGHTLGELLDDPSRRVALGSRLAQMGYPTAAHDLAMLIFEAGER